jgi:hypothetical protein
MSILLHDDSHGVPVALALNRSTAQTAFPTNIGLATFLLRTPSGHSVLLFLFLIFSPLFQLCYLCVVASVIP